VWTAITHLSEASGDPFKYDEKHGYGLITGSLGAELDELMSRKGEEVQGRSGLVGVSNDHRFKGAYDIDFCTMHPLVCSTPQKLSSSTMALL
jgi:hypothetical protein